MRIDSVKVAHQLCQDMFVALNNMLADAVDRCEPDVVLQYLYDQRYNYMRREMDLRKELEGAGESRMSIHNAARLYKRHQRGEQS